MALTPEQLKQQVLKAPESAFAAICAGVDERRGTDPVDLKDILGAVIQSLKPQEVLSAVRTGLARGDAAMFQKLLDMYERARSDQQYGDVHVEIEHYTVPDVAIPHIVKHCDIIQFKPIEAAVMERREKIRNSPAAVQERKRVQALKAAGIDPFQAPKEKKTRDIINESLAERDFAELDRHIEELDKYIEEESGEYRQYTEESAEEVEAVA